jgi:S-(hydroxymethyl)glutathione dehydrogenase/alcohol dehydrogenase
VRVDASAICHTDYEVFNGSVRIPMPTVMGHEAAGEVVEIGPGVSAVAVGDRVVCSWNPACGACFFCVRGQPILCEWVAAAASAGVLPGDAGPRLRTKLGPVHVFSLIGAHGAFAVVHERSAVRLDSVIPASLACMLGCTVSTGVCGAIRAAAVVPGSSVAVIGSGAIGLCAIQGSLVAGAATVVAVDRVRTRLDTAVRVGATATIDASTEDVIEIVRAQTGGRGVDFVIEAAGSTTAFQTAFEVCRPGGRVVLLGKVDVQENLAIRFGSVVGEKTIVRSSYGGARPQRDFPMIAKLWSSGLLDLDVLVTHREPLERINDGLARISAGATLHTVLEYAHG